MRRCLHGDELDRHDIAALVQHLEVGVLRVGAGLAPHHGTGGERQRIAGGVDALAVALHLQLLQVSRQAFQALVIGRHAAAGEAMEVAVPDIEQAQHRGQVGLQRRIGEVLVHGMRAGEHGAEILCTDGDGDGQADGAPQRVAPAHPVPETESLCDAEGRGRRHVGGGRDEVPRHIAAALRHEPLPRELRIGQCLLRREGLARHDEQRALRVQAAQHAGDVVRIYVADEVKAQAAMCEGVERGHHHLRPEVAAADADVDDVAETAVAAHLLGVREHGIEHAVHFSAVQPRAARRAQCRVQHGAALAGVDRRAREHGITLCFEVALLRQVDQEAARRAVDEILREVGKDLGRLQAEVGEALRVACERLAQVELAAMRLEVAAQCRPGGCLVAARVHSVGRRAARHALGHERAALMSTSSLPASAAKARMPSASLSLAMASSFSA